MFSLIKKEFMIQKKYFLYFLGYSIFMLIIFSTSSPQMAESAYTVAVIGITYLFIQYSCAIEDQNKSEIILNSLPVSRAKIVLSKYGAVIVFTILSVVILGVVGMVVSKQGMFQIQLIKLPDIISVFTVTWLLTAVYMPIYFKFGYIKAKLFNTIIFFMFFLGPIVISSFARRWNISILESIIDFMDSKPPELVGGIMLAATMIMLLISILISTRVYYKRELN